jgi:hypothetical protein
MIHLIIFHISDPNIGVVEAAVFVLAKIAQTPGGARTVHASGECLLELLYSPNPNTRRWTCYLLGELTYHKPVAIAAELCARLVILIGWLSMRSASNWYSWFGDSDNNHRDLQECAIFALSRISRWPEHANAVVNANALKYVAEVLDSPEARTRRWGCEMLGNLAAQQSTLMYLLAIEPSVRLVSLLRCFP